MHSRFALITLLLVVVQLAAAADLSAATASPATPNPKIPQAIGTDPAPDPKFPARMEVLHIPSGAVAINGIALIAAGAGPHPVFVLFHGLPGNEKNLDLAQAVRRAGWTVVTLNYRGSWGSPGNFRFAQNLEDGRAALAYIRDPANAAKLRIDVERIVIGGHSMGGWVTAETASADSHLLGAVLISAADMGEMAKKPRASLVADMQDDMESLAGVTAQSMADELAAHATEWTFAPLVPKLAGTRLLVLYSNDGLTATSADLVAKLKSAGATRIDSAYAPTDHGWSDRRILLEALVINWLQALPTT